MNFVKFLRTAFFYRTAPVAVSIMSRSEKVASFLWFTVEETPEGDIGGKTFHLLNFFLPD